MTPDEIASQARNSVWEDVLKHFEADDGRSFEEKIAALAKEIADIRENALHNDNAPSAEAVRQFWEAGDPVYCDDSVILRSLLPQDRQPYLELAKENFSAPEAIDIPFWQDKFWDDLQKPRGILCTITDAGMDSYIGYCGIIDTAAPDWEIEIELLKAWQRQGIGYRSLCGFLNAVAERCGVSHFRVRIMPVNAASQALFEKLGAKPNGISEYVLHGDEISAFEEKNLSMIDAHLEQVAAKFQVQPRALLSHLLEYRLDWKLSQSE